MTLYGLLGVRRGASPDEIKRAYRRLARKYHPNVNPGDRRAAELYQRISSAYETLIDPERRRQYDALEQVSGEVVESKFEFTGFDFSVAVEGPRASTFGELFADALQVRVGAVAGGAAEPGSDLYATVSIGFEEAIRGTRCAVHVTRLERCAPCGGFGRIEAPTATCAACDGLGHVRGARGHMVFSRTCPWCNGTGVTRHRTCAACGGEGNGAHVGPIEVHVPPGVENGTELAIPGEGHAGRRGGRPGALRLTVQVRPHRFFRRVGDEIWLDVPVAVHEAALGARIEVPVVGGRARVVIPPSTQTGDTIRLPERGAPRHDGSRGDLVLRVTVVLPSPLNERSRELFRELATLHAENVREVWRLLPPRAQVRVTPDGTAHEIRREPNGTGDE